MAHRRLNGGLNETAESSPGPSLNPARANEYPISVNWVRRMQFVGTDEAGHSIVLDTSHEAGGEGSGPSPTRLLLMAVACCTAIDVVSILEKSRQKLTGLSVLARGVQREDYPRYFSEIHLLYRLEGLGLDKSRVERAIKLSKDKYCSVGATVSGMAKILIKYEILERNE